MGPQRVTELTEALPSLTPSLVRSLSKRPLGQGLGTQQIVEPPIHGHHAGCEARVLSRMFVVVYVLGGLCSQWQPPICVYVYHPTPLSLGGPRCQIHTERQIVEVLFVQ